MIKVAQFGEGNFLRSFIDLYFETLNQEGYGPYEVNVIKPTASGNLDKFDKQNNQYHVILRGFINKQSTEEVYKVNVLKKVFSPFINYQSFLNLAVDKDLKIIVSNTTEAGIAFNKEDKINDFGHMSYPAKITKFLLERFNHHLPGVYLLPAELIDNNASKLQECVLNYISLWNLSNDFKNYILNECYFLSTLVDRIVSGYPKDEITKKHLLGLIKEDDALLSIGEPFGLWVIEDKGNIREYIKEGLHNINVILTKDISYYKKRKVRVLNGSHTNLVPISLFMGKETVFDAMRDDKLSQFIKETLNQEINPFVSDDINKTNEFAESVLERFLNPYLNHQLTSIALNSISKWKARVLPTFLDYYKKNNQIPKNLTIGFSYLIKMYQNIYKEGDKYKCQLPSRIIDVRDDLIYLEYFKHNNVSDFLKDTSIWDIDLTTLNNLEEEINSNLAKIDSGISLL